jgi:hypothetical protein
MDPQRVQGPFGNPAQCFLFSGWVELRAKPWARPGCFFAHNPKQDPHKQGKCTEELSWPPVWAASSQEPHCPVSP